MARRLHLKPKTVRNYLSAICAKLGVADRTQAALLAREARLHAHRPVRGLPQRGEPEPPVGVSAGVRLRSSIRYGDCAAYWRARVALW